MKKKNWLALLLVLTLLCLFCTPMVYADEEETPAATASADGAEVTTTPETNTESSTGSEAGDTNTEVSGSSEAGDSDTEASGSSEAGDSDTETSGGSEAGDTNTEPSGGSEAGDSDTETSGSSEAGDSNQETFDSSDSILEKTGSYEDEPEDEATPLTFTALEDGASISLSGCYAGEVAYSIDGGETWLSYAAFDGAAEENSEESEEGEESERLVITLENKGDEVLFKGRDFSALDPSLAGDELYDALPESGFFTVSGEMAVSGDLTALLNECGGDEDLTANCFTALLRGCTELTDCSDLCLPSETLAQGCYAYLFEGCTSLTAAPELPATVMEDSCYRAMFADCAALTAAPALAPTQAADSCFDEMFRGCVGLKVTEAEDKTATWDFSAIEAEDSSWCEDMLAGLTAEGTLTSVSAGGLYLVSPAVVSKASTGYTITFEANGGSAVAQQTGMTALPSPLPLSTKEGYTFGGWYTDEELTNAAVTGSAITKDTTLYARWEEEWVEVNNVNIRWEITPILLEHESAYVWSSEDLCYHLEDTAVSQKEAGKIAIFVKNISENTVTCTVSYADESVYPLLHTITETQTDALVSTGNSGTTPIYTDSLWFSDVDGEKIRMERSCVKVSTYTVTIIKSDE